MTGCVVEALLRPIGRVLEREILHVHVQVGIQERSLLLCIRKEGGQPGGDGPRVERGKQSLAKLLARRARSDGAHLVRPPEESMPRPHRQPRRFQPDG